MSSETSLPGVTTSPAQLPSVSGMEASIEVSGLRKRFGSAVALDGLSFTVQPGQVTGFVGPNGAGKTTTMRVILGLDSVDDGSALINGRPYRSLRRPLAQVGSLLDAAALQPSRTGRNHLLWLAHSQGLTARRVDEVIESAGMEKAARRKAGGYSLGMRQRLGIAAAMLGDPPVLMLDEPFNGLDPRSAWAFKAHLVAMIAQGDTSVLLATHSLDIAERHATQVVLLMDGRVRRSWDASELAMMREQPEPSLENAMAEACGL